MSKCPERIVELKIREKTADKIRSYARLVDTECYGGLMGDPRTKIIEDAYLYWGQEVTLTGIYISTPWQEYSLEELKKMRPDLRYMGWWHSHVGMDVFDSHADLTNTDWGFGFESYIVETQVGPVSYLFYVVVNNRRDMKSGVRVCNSCGYSYQGDLPIAEIDGGPDYTKKSLREETKEKVFPPGKPMPPEPKIDDSPIPISQLIANRPEIIMPEEDEFGKLVELASKYNLSLVGYTEDSHNLLKQAASKYGGMLFRPRSSLIDTLASLVKLGRSVTYRPKREKGDG